MNCCARCISSCCVASMNPQPIPKQASSDTSRVDGVTTLSASGGLINEVEVDISHFSKPNELLGIGGFGLVRKVKKLTGPDAGQEYAMKSTSKTSILARSTGLQAVMTELKVLILLRDKSSTSQATQTNAYTNTNSNSNNTQTHTTNMDVDGSEYICQLHYAFQDSTHLYFVLDYAIGGDMRYNMRRCSYFRFSELLVQIFIKQVFYALQYCHDNNILHRDIKPENILLHSSGKVSLSDFGVAKLLPDIEACRSTSGTHGYMAPEVYTKEHTHGTAFDWFAAGVTTFELLTGRRPFEACKIQQFHLRTPVLEVSSGDNQAFDGGMHQTPSDNSDGVCSGLCGVGAGVSAGRSSSKSNSGEAYVQGRGEDELEVEDLRAMYGVSNMCMDFLLRILCPNPHRRIGAKGNFKSLITHPFLSCVSLYPYPYHTVRQMLPHFEGVVRQGQAPGLGLGHGGALVKPPPGVSKVNLSSGEVQGAVRAHLQGAGSVSEESQDLFKHFEFNLRYEATLAPRHKAPFPAPAAQTTTTTTTSAPASTAVPMLTPTKRGGRAASNSYTNSYSNASSMMVAPSPSPCSPPFSPSPSPSPSYSEKKMRAEVGAAGKGPVGWGWGSLNMQMLGGGGGSDKMASRSGAVAAGNSSQSISHSDSSKRYTELKKADAKLAHAGVEEGEEMKECSMV